MSGQSSKFERGMALGAVAAAFAIGGVAATGCGDDDVQVDVDTKPSKSVQEQIDSVRSEAEEKAESAQEKAESVAEEAEQEAQDQAGGY